MKTLVEKDLVYERGRPLRKYALTDEGWVVAKRIKNSTGKEDKLAVKPAGLSAEAGPGRFIDIGEGTAEEEAPAPQLHYMPSNILKSNHHIGNKMPSAGRQLGGDPSDKYGVLAAAKGRNNKNNPTNTPEFLELLSSSPLRPTAMPQSRGNRIVTNSNIESGLSNTSLPLHKLPNEAPSSTKTDFPPFQPVRLNPGSFAVQLVLDNREVRAKTDRDYIQDELRKKGVEPIVRPLELGDALWVAKCSHPATLSMYGEEGDEVVLDWIVERKRLDDLVGSIKDGRFHEQKVHTYLSPYKSPLATI